MEKTAYSNAAICLLIRTAGVFHSIVTETWSQSGSSAVEFKVVREAHGKKSAWNLVVDEK